MRPAARQTGGHWGAAAYQNWSAAVHLRLINSDVSGIEFGTGDIIFRSTPPPAGATRR